MPKDPYKELAQTYITNYRALFRSWKQLYEQIHGRRETEFVVLITGSEGGIGKATELLFSFDGWRVVGADKTLGIDITKEQSIKHVLRKTYKTYGRLDVLVNNAAIQINKSLLETTEEDWDCVMTANLKAVFMMSKLAHPLLKLSSGSIVNIASVHGSATLPNRGAYPTSKAGLVGLTRSMAIEWASDDIRVNCVQPGAVDTIKLRKTPTRRVPMARIGTPEEVAQVILFLADKTRSGFITGQTIVIDGGVLACLSSDAGRECNKSEYECNRNAAIAEQWFEHTYGPLTEEGKKWIAALEAGQ